jgi:hypothetical protein
MKKDRAGSAPWWGEFPLQVDGPQCREIGPLRLWHRAHLNDFWLSFENEEGLAKSAADTAVPDGAVEERPGDEPPEDTEWLRWVMKETHQRMRLTPAFPDLPVVVKPEATLVLAPRVEVCVYVRCPLWVKLELLGAKDRTIKEIPTARLSNTWFGDYFDGMLCYWISSGAQRELAPDPARAHLAICPIHITNRSDENLSVEKICLRVEQLSLYAAQDQLWADEMRVAYRGSKNVSQLEAAGKPPKGLEHAECLAKPRNPTNKRFFAKTFLPLMALSGIGVLWD